VLRDSPEFILISSGDHPGVELCREFCATKGSGDLASGLLFLLLYRKKGPFGLLSNSGRFNTHQN
jgi:hypothetical protein